MEMEEKKSCCANKTTKRPEEELRKLVKELVLLVIDNI